jgi:hypothetical protein
VQNRRCQSRRTQGSSRTKEFLDRSHVERIVVDSIDRFHLFRVLANFSRFSAVIEDIVGIIARKDRNTAPPGEVSAKIVAFSFLFQEFLFQPVAETAGDPYMGRHDLAPRSQVQTLPSCSRRNRNSYAKLASFGGW